MKNIVRALVIVLTLTGSAAYTQIKLHNSATVALQVNAVPTPMCPPNDPKGCGIYGK